MPQEEEGCSSPPETSEQPGVEEEDYIFRFGLEPAEPDRSGYEDPLLELIRGQLADLLDAVTLTFHGQRVRVDGFRLLQDPDTQYEVFPSAADAGAEGG